MVKLLIAAVIVAGLTGASLQLPITQPARPSTLAVKPVTVQRFSDLTEPMDVQPALGYNALQRTYNVQQAGRYGQLQHTVTDYDVQPTVLDYSVQGEQLHLQ